MESVHVPKLAARLVLAHRFTDRVSLRLSYLRPARWVQYRNLNGDASSHSVWMNVAGLSLRRHVPIGPRLSLYGEGGVGVITRHGIEVAGRHLIGVHQLQDIVVMIFNHCAASCCAAEL